MSPRGVARALALAVIGLGHGESAHASGVADTPLRADDSAGASAAITAAASPQTSAVETHVLVATLAGAWRFRDRLVLSLDAGAAFGSYRFANQDRGTRQRTANPVVALVWRSRAEERVSLRLGLAAGAPLLTVPGTITQNVAAEQTDRAAAAATGQGMFWMWARNAVPLVALARIDVKIGSRVTVRADLEPGALVSVNRDSSYVALLTSIEPSVRVTRSLTPGLRLTAVASGRALDTRDFGQTVASLFLRWDAQGAFFVSGEGSVGLDAPQGMADRYASAWGVTLLGGARF